MNPNEAFDAAYKGMNDEQRGAVDAIEGPVFVIAGPGTGKTQVLTLRIANILRLTDTPPESILALTFTEAAAREMRERLRKVIGSRANKVRMHTFHGFAERVITEFPDHFPRIIGAQVATDAERAEIFDAVLLNTPVQHLRPFGDPLYYHPSVKSAISTLKRENVSPDALAERVKEERVAFDAIEGKVHEKGKYAGQMKGDYVALLKKIEKTEDLLAVYRAYEAALTEARRYDFDDLILEVVRALEFDPVFRLQVQESLLYILADEHQDANRSQNALLELVSGFHDRPNLFIVGDEKQAIYRFQGADLDNVHYFRQKFEGTAILTLIENYRSTQSILDSALSLISASPDERLSRAPLVAHAGYVAKPLTLTVCSTPDEEMATLVANIRTAIESGTVPGEIAVLVRRNRDVADVARALMRAGVPATGSGEDDALANRFVQALLRLLRVAADPRDENLAGVLTLPGFPLRAADAARLTQFARKEKRTILSVLADKAALTDAKIADIEGAQKLGASIEELSRMASFERPATVADRALQISGLLPLILAAPDRAESLGAIRGLLLALEDLSRREHDALLLRALTLLDLYAERGISLPGRGGEDETRVKVMTVHKSKGREFAQVFLPNLTSRSWSTRAHPEHFQVSDVLSGENSTEDLRRLLYVAITRAKEHATLSYSVTGEDDRAQDPMELLEEINPALIENVPPTVPAADALPSFISQETNALTGTPSEDDFVTLRATFFAQGLSPTALNNYLECPWKYFYVNLLRIPEVENKFMLFGTAIHTALNVYADERVRGKDIGTDGLLSVFTRSLERAPLSEREQKEMQEKGERALKAWWADRHETWPAAARAEVPVDAEIPLEGAHADEVLRIRGKLDRVDETAGGVNVIDYKTGKPKSRNELMGSTKDANRNYYRQLAFYKLLLERTEQPQHMQDGIIEFVEPDDKGRIRTEVFTITDDDVNELVSTIQKSASEILSLSFWNDPCEVAECPWCALRFGIT
ncbi:MAG: UvrD/REP helicase, helicase / ATP-dependent helicase PcrA [Parcubacteria group bacterium]|nr:UvrD/REP helicase, helicase / ATP-dependent helicase PcrA [Parcubacteria group bacterium]